MEDVSSTNDRISWRVQLEALFVISACAWLWILPGVPGGREFALTFLALTLEALPFVLLGALVSGFIEIMLPKSFGLFSWMGRHRLLSLFMAGWIGLVFPVCECAIVVVVRRLLRKGMPLSSALCYLLAGPLVNSIVLASTAVAYLFDWQVVAWRLGLGYLVAVLGAWLIERLLGGHPALIDNAEAAAEDTCGQAADTHDHEEGCAHHHHHHHEAGSSRLRAILLHAREDFLDVAALLIIGTFAAALIRTYVPSGLYERASDIPAVGILVMMLMAVGLNLCSEADAFVAASFRQVLPLSSQLAFMVLGPMLDLKLMTMYLGVFRRRLIILLCLVVPSLVFILINLLVLSGVLT